MRSRLFTVGFVLFLLATTNVSAVPSLQLYGSGSTWDPDTESWFTTADPFELWVVGARTPDLIHMTDQVKLFIALPTYGPDWDMSNNPTMTIQTIVSSDPVALGNPDKNPLDDWSLTLTAADLQWGRPPEFDAFGGGGLPWHGIYPAWYWTVDLWMGSAPELHYKNTGAWPVYLDVDDKGEKAYNFTQGFDPAHPQASGVDKYGDVQYYLITYSPYSPDMVLHTDAIGFSHNGWSAWRFAPFSHDCDAGGPVPEPATVTLLIAGVAGVSLQALRRQKKQRA